jgi:hypothetical protein
MITVLGVLASLAFGFLFGRIWQIRRDELENRRAHSAANRRKTIIQRSRT